jgi:hypothetical protein
MAKSTGVTQRKTMIERIPQRSKEDCAICAVAMVMGSPYTYERVLADSAKYERITQEGKFLAWWELYLSQEGFQITYRPFLDLYVLPQFHGSVLALLGMDIPSRQAGHIVAVDELGVVDCADNGPDHVDVAGYILNRLADGCVFHKEFLAVRRLREM